MDNINKKLENTFSKQVQVYELINKIQNVINTDSLLPQFIYFAKNMEEMRKKWLQSELKCKELETKLTLEKNMFQRKINELKVDIEISHEKRLQAENKSERMQMELEKLQKQFDMFKEILSSDKRSTLFINSGGNYEDRLNILSTCNLNDLNIYQQQFKSNNENADMFEINNSKRYTQAPSEETGLLISDYTADDIDLPNDDMDIDDDDRRPPLQLKNNNNNKNTFPLQPSTLSLPAHPNTKRNSGGGVASSGNRHQSRRVNSGGPRKRDQQHHSSSLTRNNEQRISDNKRSRTRSNDKENQATTSNKILSTPPNPVSKGITAITTMKIGEDGGPITVTSEIQHSVSNDAGELLKPDQVNLNNNKLEVSYTLAGRVKSKKNKRPSREFLQRSADESESNEDSRIFWDVSDVVLDDDIAENANKKSNNNNNVIPNSHVNIMTPILEQPTPTSQRIYSATASSAYKARANATPRHPGGRLVNNLLPLAKKYKKAHLFKAQVILNSEMCAHCDKRTRFGKMIMRCRECDTIVHSECKDALQRPCYPAINFSAHGCISDYVNEDDAPQIPPILQMIINEIETKGLLAHEVGLYRVNGSDSQIKQIKERLAKRHQLPDLRKINDVHVLCSFVKDFLNNLNEHLINYDSWFRFARACDLQNESDRVFELKQAIQDLPQANRDTLAFLILHLQRISETPECKMPASNLARVFGPSIVGNSSPNLQAADIINELKIQHQVVESLIKLPTQFYSSMIETSEQQQQRLFKNAAKTPELMRKSKTAVVLSSILGPAANVQ